MGELEVVADILSAQLLVMLIVADCVFMKAHHHSQLRDKVILHELAFSLVSVRTIEILGVPVPITWLQVSLEQSEPQ